MNCHSNKGRPIRAALPAFARAQGYFNVLSPETKTPECP
jgi:hypothetical protein